MQFHPDKNPGDKQAEAKFKEATEAYAVLSDEDKRRTYDQFGHGAFEGGAGGFQGFQGFEGFEDIFGDILSSFFGGQPGGGRGRSRAQPGSDLRYDMEVSFEDAAFGAEKEIEIKRRRTCKSCSGSGVTDKSTKKSCQQCGGQGQIRMQQGFFAVSRACPACQGVGEIIENPCTDCRGSGLKAASSKLKVNIPAGIDNGQRLKLRGEGESGRLGGGDGDLYIVIAIKPHKIFQRQESEILCEVQMPYSTAVLGGEITVPTLEGQAKLKIPAGTISGKVFKLKNKGIQILGTSQRGDQHVRVHIHVPKKMSEKHTEIINKLKKVEEGIEMENTEGIFDKVKSFFQ